MKKLGLIVLLSVTLLTGCFNTELVAPDNSADIKVMSSTTPAGYHKQYRNWYLLWGALPLYVTQPEELIAKNHLIEARVQTKDTVMDGFLSYFLSQISLLPQTVVVEGNYRK
jgi:hypothetical protein